MTNLNHLEQEIISVLEDIIQEYEVESNLDWMTDTELAQVVFQNYLRYNFDSSLATLHDLVDCVSALPCELIPVGLFRAGMQTAMEQVRWDAIASHENIQPKLKKLREGGCDGTNNT